VSGIIYIATNKINGKRYVGQTINLGKRLNGHKNSKYNVPFAKAVKKYGIDGFEFITIRYKYDFLNFWESHWIEALGTLHPYGYNLMTGGAAPRHSEETKKKISEGKIGPLNYNYGKHFTEEHKRKISEANKAREPRKGWNHSEETKRKRSEAMRGKPLPESAKIKISKWMKENRLGENNSFYGKTHSEESRKKIGVAFKGKPWTENRRKAYELGVKQNGLKKKEVQI